MNEKTLRVLEFGRILELLEGEAVSPMGKDRIRELRPTDKYYEIETMLTETTEAVSVIMHKGKLPFGHLFDIKKSIRYAEKGGVLTMKQLLEVGYNLRAAASTWNLLKTEKENAPVLWGMGEILNVNKKLEDHISACIISEDEMADTASPELRNIRRSIVHQNEAIRAKMSSILASADLRDMMQDSLFTMRAGRFVIPVKQEHKARIPGIVHDRSSTGATIFVEPQAIVNLNNELRELEAREKAEISRILAELSSEVGDDARHLINNQKLLTSLDIIFARGRMSVNYSGNAASLNNKGYISIKKGRHPLLNPETVVPVSVDLGKKYNTLVITGPNTGGKTVTIKTVGLFLLMNQCGLHVPAAPGTQLPVMKKIYADIGDEQSIEQSLSTFSSHMKNIVEIVSEADKDTFAVLDELGAGTDPTEGAALAIAVLDHIYKAGAKTLATTHYNELKKYAISTAGVENASMEFDVETLSPTYRLTVGTPGRSNAFEISKKLGLPEEITDRARNLLDQDDIRFEEVLAEIERSKNEADQDRDEALRLKLKLQKQSDELDAYEEKLERKKQKMLEDARAEADRILDETRSFADDIKHELRDLENAAMEARMSATLVDTQQKQNEIRQRIKKQKGRHKETIKPEVNNEPVDVSRLKAGDTVKIVSLGQNAVVVSLPADGKGDITVQAGLLKVSVKPEDLAFVQEKSAQQSFKKSGYGAMYRQKSATVATSINVIGKNLDEAVMLVDKYLDDAFMSGLGQVSVIHGRGAGILKKGLGDLFKRHRHVARFRSGGYYEGGEGVTVVELMNQ